MNQQFVEAESSSFASGISFKVLTDSMPQMVWSTRPDGYHDFYNAQWYEFTGVPAGSTDGEGWAGMFHPEDVVIANARWRHSLQTGDPYEVEYRLRHASGEYRWTIGRANPIRDHDGRIVRWIGTCTDIHEAKLIAEQNEILSHELSHRIKNIFSVILGLIGTMARQFSASKDFATSLRDRVAALGRAHEFVRPHSKESRTLVGPTTIRGLCEELFRPYPAMGEGRIAIHGKDVVVDDRGATPLSLVFHELATNAVKYGALSDQSGTVDVTITDDGQSTFIEWRESGGPSIVSSPASAGFGSRLIELSVVRQLGGKLERTWDPSGLTVKMAFHSARLARGHER